MTAPPLACFVCEALTEPAFSKTFTWHDLGEVSYVRCPSCGFVASSTHAAMSEAQWADLNHAFHIARDPAANRSSAARAFTRLEGYAAAIADAARAGAIATVGTWLDYGCGEGRLAGLIEAATSHPVLRYEPYMPKSDGPWVDRAGQGHALVVNTAMFEHVLDRASLDAVVDALHFDGVLALHTVIGPEVPNDPEWFYLLPPHCAFFTNESMRRLCEQWGFSVTAYHERGKLWLLSRSPKRLAALQDRDGWRVATGFLAYWT